MPESINPAMKTFTNALDARIVADAEKLYKEGVRSNTLSEAVVNDFAAKFVTSIKSDLSTLPIVKLDESDIDALGNEYPQVLYLAMQIKEGLIK